MIPNKHHQNKQKDKNTVGFKHVDFEVHCRHREGISLEIILCNEILIVVWVHACMSLWAHVCSHCFQIVLLEKVRWTLSYKIVVEEYYY